MEILKWTEEDSAKFIDHGKAFTPLLADQYRIIGELVSQDGISGTVHELCSGAGELAKLILEKNPDITLKAWDGSPAMIERTLKTCRPYNDRLQVELFDLANADWRGQLDRAGVVYSSLAIHHLDGPGKRQLFKDIYSKLQSGGRFIMADLMMPASKVGLTLCAWQWEQEVARNSAALYQDNRAEDAFHDLKWNFYHYPYDDPIDKPSSVQEQLNWLSEAGFSEVDLHWMVAGHAIISGRKI